MSLRVILKNITRFSI